MDFSNAQNEAEDFNDYEEDEATRRIREEQQRVQATLREKSVDHIGYRIENGRKKMKESVKEKDSLRSISKRRRKRNNKELPKI